MDVSTIEDAELAKGSGTGRVIRIGAEVEKRLIALGKFDQTFSDVIRDLLDEHDAIEASKKKP